MLLVAAAATTSLASAQSGTYSNPYPPNPPSGSYQDGDSGQYDDPYSDTDGDWDADSAYEPDNSDSYSENARPSYGNYDDQRGPGVDVGFFYNELSPYGEWVHRNPYGWVWFPRRVPANWRPYAYGRWVDSDYGWTWVSAEPFGWATYHYGRWAYDRYIGWVWVPGTVWGPAWVAWQQGGGYVGWAPLPPEIGFDIGVGLRLGGLNLSFSIRPTRYTFVEERQFLAPRVSTYLVPTARNVTIIHNTTNITNYTYVDNHVVNRGIPVDRIERATGQRVRRLRVSETQAPSATKSLVQNDQIRIYRPSTEKLRSVAVAERNNAGVRRPQPNPGNPDMNGNRRPDAKVPDAPNGRLPSGSSKVAPAPPVIVAPRTIAVPKVTEQRDLRQDQQEQQKLRNEEMNEQRRLEKMHQQEMAQAKARPAGKAAAPANPVGPKNSPELTNGASAAELQKRHAAEMQAQEQERKRAEQQLATRQQIARQATKETASRPAPQAQVKPATPPKPQEKRAAKAAAAQKEKPKENDKPPGRR
ncbi:MAG: cell envelope integrity protein TolA [Thermoanaerobaculia bacterium]